MNRRADLAAFVEQLRWLREHEDELGQEPRHISRELASYVIEAIEGRLVERHRSLEHAFGLIEMGRPKGDPGNVNYRLAKRAIEKRMAGKSWRVTVDELHVEGTRKDVKEVRQLVKDYGPRVLAEIVSARVNAKRRGRK